MLDAVLCKIIENFERKALCLFFSVPGVFDCYFLFQENTNNFIFSILHNFHGPGLAYFPPLHVIQKPPSPLSFFFMQHNFK